MGVSTNYIETTVTKKTACGLFEHRLHSKYINDANMMRKMFILLFNGTYSYTIFSILRIIILILESYQNKISYLWFFYVLIWYSYYECVKIEYFDCIWVVSFFLVWFLFNLILGLKIHIYVPIIITILVYNSLTLKASLIFHKHVLLFVVLFMFQ